MPKSRPARRPATRSGDADCPDRFDVVWLATDQQSRGRRPAYVLTPKRYNILTGLCIACPMTNQVKGYPFEVAMPHGARVGGVMLVDQVKSVSWSTRRAEIIESYAQVYDDVMGKLEALLRRWVISSMRRLSPMFTLPRESSCSSVQFCRRWNRSRPGADSGWGRRFHALVTPAAFTLPRFHCR
jgi:mRNA interferase MazF